MFGYLLTLNAIRPISAPADVGQQNDGHKPDAFNPQHDTNDMGRMDNRTRANQQRSGTRPEPSYKETKVPP